MNKKSINYLIVFVFLLIFYSCTQSRSGEVVADLDSITNSSLELRRLNCDEFLLDPDLRNALTSVYVFDDSLNIPLASLNENMAICPASVTKLITTATALELFNTDTCFVTRLQIDGLIDKNTILNGNIYIKGGGDPALGSRYFQEYYDDVIQKWVKAIKEKGIKEINGSVIADEQIFDSEVIPETWSWGEIVSYYCAMPSGLSIYDNRYLLKIKPSQKGKIVSSPENIQPYIPDLVFENRIEIDNTRNEEIYFVGAPFQNYFIAKGTVPVLKNTYQVEGAIPDPPYLSAYLLHKALMENNIIVRKTPQSLRKLKIENLDLYTTICQNERTQIYAIKSPKLSEIIKITNQKSNNLFAETILNQIGLKINGIGNTENGLKAEFKFLKDNNFELSGLHLFDGSGISRYNTVTAKLLVDLLLYMKKSPNFKLWFSSFPVSGENGTLKYFGLDSPLKGRIYAKSGTMSRVRAYSGYIKAFSGKIYPFAIIANNYNCESVEMKQKIENFLTKIVVNY